MAFFLRRPRLATATSISALGLGLDYALAPKLRLSSAVAASAGSIGSVQVFQYEICPYCNKVKALLDLHRLPYETTEVNPLTKREIKEWSGGYRKVPIAKLAGEQINDSSLIAQAVMDRMSMAGVLSEPDLAAFRSTKATEWAEWSDKELAVLLFPNITRSYSEAYEAFGYVMDVPHFSTVEKWSNQLIGSFFMWMAQGKIKKKCAKAAHMEPCERTLHADADALMPALERTCQWLSCARHASCDPCAGTRLTMSVLPSWLASQNG